MAFPNETKGTDKKDGADLSLTTAKTRQFYESIDWGFRDTLEGPWEIDENNSFPYFTLSRMGFNLFPNETKGTDKKDGADLILSDARRKVTYEAIGWDIAFASIFAEANWYIFEHATYPYPFDFDVSSIGHFVDFTTVNQKVIQVLLRKGGYCPLRTRINGDIYSFVLTQPDSKSILRTRIGGEVVAFILRERPS